MLADYWLDLFGGGFIVVRPPERDTIDTECGMSSDALRSIARMRPRSRRARYGLLEREQPPAAFSGWPAGRQCSPPASNRRSDPCCTERDAASYLTVALPWTR
jgi:hypothetical protein